MSSNRAEELLNYGGEMGALMRTVDWTKTPLGPMESWPQSLQTAVSICLLSRFPILIWWGHEYIKIYNDAYRPILGAVKHPSAMGQRGQDCWAEIWHIIGPMLDSVFYSGQATWSDDQMLPLERNGYAEECYFTFSYSPIHDETGGIGGIFTAVTETTKRVLGERRLKTLRDLGNRAADGKSAQEACQVAAEILKANTADVPFALFYLLDDDQHKAWLAGTSEIMVDDIHLFHEVSLDDRDPAAWPLWEVDTERKSALISDLSMRFTDLPTGPWDEPVRNALLLPILSSGENRIIGYFIGGISPRLALDEDYRGFYDLVVGQAATAIANAMAYESEQKRINALIKLDKAKTEFFSNISHEFRTPLTLILNPLQDLLTSNSDTLIPAQQENLRVINRNARRLLKLVNTLLDFSRIQSDRIEAVFEATDLATLTADIASTFRSTLERAGIRFIVDCPPLAEPIYVDRDMWEKIVLNLLSNAFKFTFEGEISISLHTSDQFAQLVIRDTGIGIPASEMPHLFERFHRVYGARARSNEGSGIGLALVQELVRLHGGQITVESTPGNGTTFTIAILRGTAHLPPDQVRTGTVVSSAALGAAPYIEEVLQWLPEEIDGSESLSLSHIAVEPTNDIIPRTGQMTAERVLIVDDNTDMRAYLVRLLQERYTVEQATDGVTALESIRKQQPALILTDVMMPNLDGFALLTELRSAPNTNLIPVIMLSARAGEEARVEALQAGADDYIVKPFTARELVARIETHLKIARLRQEIVLQERQTRLQIEQILESISDAFYTVDRNWQFIYVNRKAAQLWRRTREELIGKNIWEALPLSYGNETYIALHEAFVDQQMRRFETFGPYQKEWFTVNVFPTQNELSVYFHSITEQKRSENAQRFLISAGTILSSSLDYETTFQNVVKLAIPDLADCCLIDSLEENRTLRTVAVAHVDPSKVALIREIRERFPPNLDRGGYADAIAQRKSQFISEIPDAFLESAITNTTQLGLMRELGLRSFIVTPIIGHDKILGIITFLISNTDRQYKADDLALAEELARRAAVAIENAQLYREAQNQRQRFQVTLASIGDAVITTDLDSRITFMNGVAEMLTGWTNAEAVGQDLRNVFQIINEQTRSTVENPVSKVLREKAVSGPANHTILIARNGTERFIDDSAAPIQGEDNEIFGVILIFRDVTERRRTEDILEKTLIRTQDLYQVSHQIGLASTPEEILQALLTSQSIGVISQAAILILTDSDQHGQTTNYEIMVKLHADQDLPGLENGGVLTNALLTAVFSSENAIYISNIRNSSSVPESLKQVFYQANTGGIALSLLNANDERFGLLVLYCPPSYEWNTDDIRHLQIFSEQVSVSIRNIRLLVAEANARREAEQANQLKLQFLGMISHELRTPLTSIKGFSTSLLATDVIWEPEQQRDFINIISNESDKLTDLISQLLDLSQLQAGMMRIQPTPHSLAKIIDNTMIQLKALTPNHHLMIHVPNDLPLVLADAPRIAEVISNLVGNAAKYSPEGTTIAVKAALSEKMATIEVSDQGPGIPREGRVTVFEAFRQLERKSPEKSKGAGLGLAICKGLVEAHHGQIWIADEPASGTTICFTLPLADSISPSAN